MRSNPWRIALRPALALTCAAACATSEAAPNEPQEDGAGLSVGEPHSLHEAQVMFALQQLAEVGSEKMLILPPPQSGEPIHTVVGMPQLGGLVTAWGGVECTATQVSDKVLITAAHCFGCESATERDNFMGFWFMTYPDDRPSRDLIPIQRVESLGACNNDGTPVNPARDVALAVLSVPRPIATPGVNSTSDTNRRVRIYGAGCLSFDNVKYSRGNRRYVEGPWQTFINDNVLCFGDSGGPVVDAASNNVIGVNVGFIRDTHRGVFSVLDAKLAAEVQARVAKLSH